MDFDYSFRDDWSERDQTTRAQGCKVIADMGAVTDGASFHCGKSTLNFD